MQKGPSSGPFRLLRCRNDPAGAAYFFFGAAFLAAGLAAAFLAAGFLGAAFSWWLTRLLRALVADGLDGLG
jgi:hypothetical protein